jgi:hypothetical protein
MDTEVERDRKYSDDSKNRGADEPMNGKLQRNLPERRYGTMGDAQLFESASSFIRHFAFKTTTKIGLLWICLPFILPILGAMSRYDRPSHQVYMYFFLRSGWQVELLSSLNRI